MRKTVSVEFVKDKANLYLDLTIDEHRAQRIGVIALVESVLFSTDNYKGWSFLPSEYLSADEQTPDSVLVPDADDTRRVYH